MTTSQELIWTALPNGVAADGARRLSAMVSPRLKSSSANPTLAEFADFLDWPKQVNGLTFQVRVGNAAPVATTIVSAKAESDLWTQLFRDGTRVESFAFRDRSNRNIRSYPVAGILAYLDGLYQDVATTSPADLPPIGSGGLEGLLHDLGGITGHFRLPHGPGDGRRLDRNPQRIDALLGTEEWRKHDGGNEKDGILGRAKAYGEFRRFRALDSAFAAGNVVPPGANPGTFGFSSAAALDFYQAHRFYDRPEMLTEYLPEPDAAKVPPHPEPPKFDFHRIVAALGDYPVLLRRLGLVVDLTVDPALIPASGVLRVIPDQPLSATNVHRTPGTNFEHTATRFATKAGAASDLVDGMLRLEGTDDSVAPPLQAPPFSLVQVDVDGAAMKLVNMASQLWAVHNPNALMGKSFDTPDKTGLPGLQSAGVALVRNQRAARLAARLVDEKARGTTANPDTVTHFADHLLRGYRLDVDDGTGWRSLCQREGRYLIRRSGQPDVPITNPDGTPIVDEGYVKAGSTTSADAKDSDLYFHEAIVKWDGWSIVAKRPGRTIVAEESADRLHQDEKVAFHESEQSADVPLNTSFVPVKGSLPRLRFGSKYRVRARAVDLAGNSVELDGADDAHASDPVVYLRFEPVTPPALVPRAPFAEGASVERLVIRSNFDQTTAEYSTAHPGFEVVDDRHVVPPKTSQLMVETHGLLEDAFSPTADPAARAAVFLLSAREAATLHSAAGSTKVEGTTAPDAEPLPAGEAPPGAYFVNPLPLHPLPYLPDPVVRGAAFRGLPGTGPTDATVVGFGGWPDLEPFVVRLQEREGAVKAGECRETFLDPHKPPELDGDRVLPVTLGKAEVAVVRYSCSPGGLLDHMAVWQKWVAPTAGEAEKRLVAEGGHWMITPYRELVLVHAVQQPLCAPNTRLVSSRSAGDTFATVRGRIMLSVRSTGQVDLGAVWTEPIDSLSDVKPRDLDGKAHVDSLRVDVRFPEPDPWPAAPPAADGTQPMPNTGGLPFGFPDLDPLLKAGMPWATILKGLEFARPITHEFGDTKHRWVDYSVTGTTRFREYFPAAITGDPTKITRTGDRVRVNILSSARPEAPKVQYIVPSFRWITEPADTEQWTTLKRTRTGGGLRVWLDRPWYSSGEGEKLAAVLWSDAQPPEHVAKLVSRLGRDPIWNAAVPNPVLQSSHFPNATDVDTGLTLAETSQAKQPGIQNTTVAVAAFDPEYDEDRQLWFCDIDVSPKAGPAYYPFVRLALARYQRHSVGGCRLSPIVQTDFAQLLPRRTLTVTFRDPSTVDITLYGPAPHTIGGNRVEVTLEVHDGSVPGDLGWEPVAAAPGRPNPVHLSDGLPDVSWIPPKIPPALGRTVKADLERSHARFKAQARPVIARENLPVLAVRDVASMLELDPAALGIEPIPVIVIPGHVLWSGPMSLPVGGRGRRRLVVREYEHFVADRDVGRLDTDKEDPHISGPFLDRVVYADIVDLPG